VSRPVTGARVVPLHRETHPFLDVEGCFGCKATGIWFGAVEGGQSSRAREITHSTGVERSLNRYRDKRQAGERPSGTTKQAMDKSEKMEDLWERNENRIAEENDPVQVSQIKKSLTNT